MAEFSGLIFNGFVGYGCDVFQLNFYEGVIHGAETARPITLKGDDTLQVGVSDVKLSHLNWNADHQLRQRAIGCSTLYGEGVRGRYDADFDVNPEWRGRGLVTTGTRELLRHVQMLDARFVALDFEIYGNKKAAVAVVTRLGAVEAPLSNRGNEVYTLTAEQLSIQLEGAATHV